MRLAPLAVAVLGLFWLVPDGALYGGALAAQEAQRMPAVLNGFGLWLSLMIALTIVNYGFPIVHLLAVPGTAVPAVRVGDLR